MKYIISWLIIVAVAIGVQIWYRCMNGEWYVEGIASEMTIIILSGMFYYLLYSSNG